MTEADRLQKLLADGLITEEEFNRLAAPGPSALPPPSPTGTAVPVEPAQRRSPTRKALLIVVPVALIALIAAVAVVLVTLRDNGEPTLAEVGTSISSTVPAPVIATTGPETTVEDPQSVVVTINVETDIYANPLPQDLSIRFGILTDRDDVFRIFEGPNSIDVPSEMLELPKQETKLSVGLFWGGGYKQISRRDLYVRDSTSKIIMLEINDFLIKGSGPWLEPFEFLRPNPTLDAECPEIRSFMYKRDSFIEKTNELQASFDSNSSISKWREVFSSKLVIFREFQRIVLDIDWIYFYEIEDYADSLRAAIDALGEGVVATNTDEVNRVVGMLNENNPVENGLADDIRVHFFDVCNFWQ